MDRPVFMIILSPKPEWPQPNERLSGADIQRKTAMTTSMQASLTEIGRRLKAGYAPILAKPLPSEIEDLLSCLVALEIDE